MRKALLLPSPNPFSLGRTLRHALAVISRPRGNNRHFTDLAAACWGGLDTPHREILQQTLVGSLSYDDIGRRMGISAEAVRARIVLARESLRHSLEEASPAFAASGAS